MAEKQSLQPFAAMDFSKFDMSKFDIQDAGRSQNPGSTAGDLDAQRKNRSADRANQTPCRACRRWRNGRPRF